MPEPPKQPTPASREEANRFLEEIEEADSDAEKRGRVLRYDRDTLERIVHRLYTDALKSPSQKRGELPTRRILEGDGSDKPPEDKGYDETPGKDSPKVE